MIANPFHFAGFLTVWLIMLVSSAQAAAVDWKFYGAAKLPDVVICFYEERGITRPKPGIVDVWAKCLLQNDLDNVPANAPYKNAWISMSAGRLAHYYHPPILSVERMNIDQIEQVVMDESLADVGDLTTYAEFYYELDCHRHMMRELSIDIQNHPGTAPTDWQYVAPESNIARLQSLLCP